LTVNYDTDPTGILLYDLFINELKFDFNKLFITNSVLCLPRKVDVGNFPVKNEIRKKCNKHLKEFILEFDPKIVCPLGVKALNATNLFEKHNFTKMKDVVAKELDWFGRKLFPLYHTANRARNKTTGRIEEMQRQDWRKLNQLYNKIII
jgi:uracil-DNA glycosylase family 4